MPGRGIRPPNEAVLTMCPDSCLTSSGAKARTPCTHAHELNVDQPLPVGLAPAPHGHVRHHDACVVEDQVDTAEVLDGLVGQGLDRIGVGDVGAHRQNIAPGGSQGFAGRLQFLVPDIGQYRLHSARAQRLSDGATDTARAASNDRDLALLNLHWSSLSARLLHGSCLDHSAIRSPEASCHGDDISVRSVPVRASRAR